MRLIYCDRTLYTTEDAAADTPRSLYINRPLVNAPDLIAWAKENGFGSTLKPADLHATVTFSKSELDWPELPRAEETVVVVKDGARSLERFDESGEAVVLRFESEVLEQRWQELRDAGASWEWGGYKPHVTLTYDGEAIDLDSIAPYDGPLIFGPELWAEIDEGWRDNFSEKGEPMPWAKNSELPDSVKVLPSEAQTVFRKVANGAMGDGDDEATAMRKAWGAVKRTWSRNADGNWTRSNKAESFLSETVKVDSELGIVFGWAMVSKVNGEDYYDLHGHNIPEDIMLAALADFMAAPKRVAADMHARDDVDEPVEAGAIVFAFPMTEDIAKGLGIETKQSGAIIGMKPDDPAILEKFKNGEYTGFSIGAWIDQDEGE